VQRVRYGAVDITGQRFGRWVAVEWTGRSTRRRQRLWLCRCDCGNTGEITAVSLRNGDPQSCGCSRIHGLREHPLYRTWHNMKQRCGNPNRPIYPNYGGRGITVCERWTGPDGFPNFLADMGEKPGWATGGIDRIDNDGNYEPGNCRWATAKTQRANQRKRRTASTLA
jgi:hypothetical protein